ncbi:unnamed protein product [Dovyalis caffra]|uniref:Uncharacterized protein n=1 Tax=Dovyalis caffra TaxID=77055 RepID=A0AAV1SH93_9ROSI|nr:unnamed protein product [Dovyalis caffra]
MARSLEPLVVGKVIGDVLDPFNPSAEFTVSYGSKRVANGCDIKPSSAAQKPHVQLLGSALSSDLYTLPLIGIHRYAFALFKQKGALMGSSRAADARANFNTRQFAAQNELGLPVAAVYFNSQKESAVRKN